MSEKYLYRKESFIFSQGFKVTQFFGSNASYYKKFGLAGHEGLDMIPVEGSWNIYSPISGVVIKDIDNPRLGGAYGNHITIWNADRKIALLFAHNSKNYVSLGQEIKAGDILATMGNTGNSSGPHVHLGMVKTDSRGYRLNKKNGYQGFINPLPLLKSIYEEDETGTVTSPLEKIKILEEQVDKLTDERNNARTERDRERERITTERIDHAKEVQHLNSEIKRLEEGVQTDINGQVTALKAKIAVLENELNTANEEIKSLNEKLILKAEQDEEVNLIMDKKILWESVKAPLRQFILAIIPLLVVYFETLPYEWAGLLYGFFVALDKFLYVVWKEGVDKPKFVPERWTGLSPL